MEQERPDDGARAEQSAAEDRRDRATAFEVKSDSMTPAPSRSFATILEGLRTAEDSFYFMVDAGPQSGMRFPIDGAQVMVGFDDSNERITLDPASIQTPAVIISKDWIGVMVQPQNGDQVVLNQEPLRAAARLRNGDQLLIALPAQEGVEREPLALTFHEPASLLVLDSLFPNKVPPPVLVRNESSGEAEGEPAAGSRAQSATGARIFLGHFTAHELLIMGVSTLLLAAVIFFVLDNT